MKVKKFEEPKKVKRLGFMLGEGNVPDDFNTIVTSDEDWSAWDTVINDSLDKIEIKAKIKKYAGIADEKLSTEQIINLTRE